MKIDVVVASCNAPASLRRCLRALSQQPHLQQIIVSDCSDRDQGQQFRAEFPCVRFLHWPRRMSMPQLRWAVWSELSAPIVAALEARCEPAADWSSRLLDAYERHPDAVVVGGPVLAPAQASRLRRALYLCEFASAASATCGAVSLANLSFRRDRLAAHREFLASGAWETVLLDELSRRGEPTGFSDAAVFYHHEEMTARDIFAQRFHYGRGYAAERVRFQGGFNRLRALAAPVLPLELWRRTRRDSQRAGLADEFRRSAASVFALHLVWAAGEFVGYALGPARRIHVY